MNTYELKKLNIQLNDEYDVIIVGGGPSGCTAAISSAREGAKTLLIEGTNALGGMSTNGLVTSWCPFSDGEKIIYRGLAEKIFNLSKKGIKHIDQNSLDWVAIDPEYLKIVYDNLMIEYGVDVLFNTVLSTVVTNENQVDVLLVTNKEGLNAYKAKVYVDCTGDADLVAFGGGAFQKGDRWSGEVQASTLCFILSNVDDFGFNHGPWLNRANKQSPGYAIQNDPSYPLIQDPHICSKLIGPSTVGFNAGHIDNVDNTNPISNSKAYMVGRQIARQFQEGLAKYFPEAFSNSFLSSTATLLGVRESRRIEGDYVLTLDDYQERRTFEDEICRNSYFLDIHSSKSEYTPEQKAYYEQIKKVKRYTKGESHGIPYRCLIPKSFSNVLVAGRSISVDRIVQGSVRVMPVALATGEAAGMAAAIASKKNSDVRNIDVPWFRNRLKEEGVYIK